MQNGLSDDICFIDLMLLMLRDRLNIVFIIYNKFLTFSLGLSSVAHRCSRVPDPFVPKVHHRLKFTLRLRRRKGDAHL